MTVRNIRYSLGCRRRPSSAAGRLLPLISLLLMVSCTPDDRVRGSALIFASGADLQSINSLVAVHPLAKQVQQHVLFLTLASYDSTFRPVSRLASWEWSSDRTMLTFHLRQDVRWHDGTVTTADDVVWTLEMARHPNVAYPRASDLGAMTAVEKSDSFTVVVRFRGVQPVFPDVLTDLAIMPRHRFAGLAPSEVRSASFNLQPVGNGPFEFAEYRPNQRWVFHRFDSFPLGLGRPNIDRFVVAVVDEPTTKLAALTSGELDFAGINPAHASFVRADPLLAVIDYPVQFSYALVWNLRRAPFDDLKVRRALSMGLDRTLLVEAYLYGFGMVADGPVSPDHPWYVSPERVPYDPARASSILEEVGWRIGREGVLEREGAQLALDLVTVGTGENALEQMVQAQLREIGVAVRIRPLELVTFLATAQGPARDFDALVTGIPGDLSLGYVAAMYDATNPGPLAYAGYRSEAFDATMRRVDDAATEAGLAQAWHDAQRILARDLPTTWLYHARGVQGMNRRVRGVNIDLRGELAGLAHWWIQEEVARQR